MNETKLMELALENLTCESLDMGAGALYCIDFRDAAACVEEMESAARLMEKKWPSISGHWEGSRYYFKY